MRKDKGKKDVSAVNFDVSRVWGGNMSFIIPIFFFGGGVKKTLFLLFKIILRFCRFVFISFISVSASLRIDKCLFVKLKFGSLLLPIKVKC
jgi:hypothetical protein